MNMENINGYCKKEWHLGPVNIGYTMLGFRYLVARKALNCKDIMHAVAAQYGLSVAEIKGNRRAAAVARPRQMAMLIAREGIPNLSLPQIAKRFCRDHSTIMHGIKAARKRLEWDEEYLDAYQNACEQLGITTDFERVEARSQACMFCGAEFMSTGPHHRFCSDQSCKRSRASAEASLETEGTNSHKYTPIAQGRPRWGSMGSWGPYGSLSVPK